MKNPGETRVELTQKKKQPNQRGVRVEGRGMTCSSEITIPLLLQTEKDEIEEGRKVDHIIDLKDLNNSSIKSRTIFKVNMGLRQSNPAAYTPKMVSIGPYHKKNPQLGPMEKYKKLYLRRFLQRKEGLNVESCISEMVKLKKEALECYDDMKDLDTKMLLLDGCFVVEFIRERCQMYPEGEEEIINFSGYMCHQIFRDLMLVENQLPFFVLNQLHHMTKQDDELPLAKLANVSLIFFIDLPNMIRVSFREIECNAVNIKHLLHLVHILSCHGRNTMKKHSNYEITRQKAMPNATELSEAGVSFVKVEYSHKEDNHGDNTSFFDITFENGLMKIPYFEIFDYTETFLRNLIAYEQQSSDIHLKCFSDYVTFLDHLIDSDKDVNLLRQKGILENWMGEDKQVASLFNRIGNGVGVYSNFYYNEEFKRAIEHCEKPWNSMKANLKHNYFSSPWVGASTVAAIIIVILTTIQTILAFTGSVM